MINDEASAITKYLINETPSADLELRYTTALKLNAPPLNAFDEKLWAFAKRSCFRLGLIDSGLGLLSPYHPIRQRIFTMMGVLETTPDYCRFFLPKKNTLLEFISIFLEIITNFFLTLVGILVIGVFKILWR